MNIIYLDLDGVINSLSRKPPRQNTQWFGDWEEKTIEGYRILWSSELVKELNSLAAREDVTIKFLTTWRELAPASFGPQVGLLGSESWSYFGATDSELEDITHWWKLDRIRKDIEDSKPEKAVWLDDDILYDSSAMNWIGESPSLLAISPVSTHGLRFKDISAIVSFLDD